MPTRKIQDETELVHWFEDGYTLSEMVEMYQEKYNLKVTMSLFSNFRRRKGLPRRNARDMNLIPWAVKPEHRGAYPLQMLRVEGRRRRGMEVAGRNGDTLESWLTRLKEADAVVHYDPDTEEGFFYVPRRPGVDMDLVRVPDDPSVLAQRGNPDERD